MAETLSDTHQRILTKILEAGINENAAELNSVVVFTVIAQRTRFSLVLVHQCDDKISWLGLSTLWEHTPCQL